MAAFSPIVNEPTQVRPVRPSFMEPDPTSVILFGNEEDVSTEEDPVSADVTDGETVVELLENTREVVFQLLDTMGRTERMAEGYWDDRESKIYHVGRQVQNMQLDLDIIVSNIKSLWTMMNREGSIESRHRIYSTTGILQNDIYIDNKENANTDHYESFTTIKMDSEA